jgi:hypothetical protein
MHATTMDGVDVVLIALAGVAAAIIAGAIIGYLADMMED